MSAISDSLTVSCVDCSISFQVASPCQQYLIALQSHVLIVLFTPGCQPMSAISDSLTVSCVDCSISFQVASPCQQYLIALQSHVLIVLFHSRLRAHVSNI